MRLIKYMLFKIIIFVLELYLGALSLQHNLYLLAGICMVFAVMNCNNLLQIIFSIFTVTIKHGGGA